MASLYKRATPSQNRILRAVEGAIKNACDAHPALQISPHHRRSIAKRAAGTLTAQWPDVLAASRRSSDSGAASPAPKTRRRSSQLLKAAGRGGSQATKPFPLRRLIAEIATPLKAMKAAGLTERADAFVDVLRIISRLRETPPPADAAAQPRTAPDAELGPREEKRNDLPTTEGERR